MASPCLCKPLAASRPASHVKPVPKQTFGRASPEATREAAGEALPNGALSWGSVGLRSWGSVGVRSWGSGSPPAFGTSSPSCVHDVDGHRHWQPATPVLGFGFPFSFLPFPKGTIRIYEPYGMLQGTMVVESANDF